MNNVNKWRALQQLGRLDPPTEPIGGEGLVGFEQGNFLIVKGPCGDGHVMSLTAAADLRDWLTEKLAKMAGKA